MEIKYLSHYKNLKIRDYANLKNIDFKLSVTEYRMKKSFFALNSLKKEISKLNGIIFFSIYQLPEEKVLRKEILNFFIQKRKKSFLH